MAFNLNKNEANNPSTKFDLSKSDSSSNVSTAPEKSKPKTWLFALLALLAVGIGAWYFLSRPDDTKENENEVATTASVTTTGEATTNNESSTTTPATNDTAHATTSNNSSTTAATTIDAGNIINKVPATFAKGSNAISGLDQAVVKNIIVFLEKNPTAAITVNGYASSEGTLAVNETISQSRADAFKKYLVAKGIPGNRINATGRGIDNPISSNDTEEGRIKNRRVEITFQ